MTGLATLPIPSQVTCLPRDLEKGSSDLELIQHLHLAWTDIVWMPQGAEILLLFQSSLVVRHTLLAVSACHLRHVAKGVLRHRIAENFQQSLAIKHLREALGNVSHKQFESTELNGLLIGAVIFNVLAFAFPESDRALADDRGLSVSWVLKGNWLSFQASLGPLLLSMPQMIEETLNLVRMLLSNIPT